MINTEYIHWLVAAYTDKTIYKHNSVWLHYKGGVYVVLGTPDTASHGIDATSHSILVRIDTVLGYGTANKQPPDVGEIILVRLYDLHNSDCALLKNGNKMRPLCECGCGGDKQPNEVYAEEWVEIESDDDLVDKSLWLSEL